MPNTAPQAGSIINGQVPPTSLTAWMIINNSMEKDGGRPRGANSPRVDNNNTSTKRTLSTIIKSWRRDG
jgi:hypothetical protein